MALVVLSLSFSFPVYERSFWREFLLLGGAGGCLVVGGGDCS